MATKLVQTILEKSNLDWQVEKIPLTADMVVENGIDQIETPYYGIIRTDNKKCLGVGTGVYYAAQNEELVELLVKHFGLKSYKNVESHVKAGGKYYSIKIGVDALTYKVGGKFEVKSEVTLSNGHTGRYGIRLGLYEWTKVCENGMHRFLQVDTQVLSHNSTLEEKLKSFDICMEDYKKQRQVHIDRMDKWFVTPVTKELVNKAIQSVARVDMGLKKEEFLEKYGPAKLEFVAELTDCIDAEFKQKGKNAFALFNGFTRYNSHHRGSENSASEVPVEARRNEMIMVGAGKRFSDDAYTFLKKQVG